MMTATETDLTLTVTRLIPAAPERVFDAWLDPAKLGQFMIPANGGTCGPVTADARVGGDFLIVMRAGGEDIPHSGTYREIDRPRRLSFTWNSRHAARDSLVTIDFAPEGAGTRVTLHHVKFNSEGARDGHVRGWTMILDTLAATFG
jgi:uncharacterized protein YndB with AHSA1/START domain